MVESLPGVGAKSPNLNLNNDVLQEVRVPLELSKVPLIPPDPTTLLSLCYQDPGIWTSTSNRFSSNSFIQSSFDKQPVFFPREECSSLQAVVDMLLKGAIQEVRDSSSLAFYSRLFLVAKKTGGWRPVIDLSHLNLYLDFPTFRMETTQSIRNSLQVGQWTTSLDLKDAYFHVPMATTVHKLLRFQVLGKVYQFVAMPFGLATAPREFTTLVKEVKRMALRLGISVHMYLDDWLIKANSCQEAQSATLTLLELTHKLGWIVNRGKSDLLPKQVFTFLGQVFDLSKGVCYPTEARFLSIQEAIHPFQPPYYSTPGYAPFGSTSFYREVSTSGSPSYATPSILSQEKLQLPPERCPGFSIHLGPFSEGSSKVVVTEAQCRGASSTAPTQVCNIHLHGCLSSGLGSSLCSHDCPRSLVDSAVQTAHQCSGAQSCAPGSQDFCTSVIPSSKDYSGSLRQHNCLCLHKQTRGHSFLGTVCPDLASVCLLSQEQSCSYSKTRSRGHESCSRPTLQVSTDPSYRVVSQPKIFRWLSQIDFQPQLDLFATKFNHKLPQYVSPVPDPKALAVDALEMNWSGLHLYSFPPTALCPLVVKKLINSQSCRMLLVAPLWETKEWLQDLLALSIRKPVALPLKENILKQPHLEVFHQNLRSLNLHAFWLKSP